MLDRDPAGQWTKTKNRHRQSGRKAVQRGKRSEGRPVEERAHPIIATIEPWHGFQVVVYTASAQAFAGDRLRPLWSRHVIAEPLQWGHAVWCADLDSDGDDELIIGQRDPNKPGAIGPKGRRLRLRHQTWGRPTRLRAIHDRRRRHGLRGRSGGRPGR